MDRHLQDVISKFSPRENYDMMEGMAYKQSEQIMSYIRPVLDSFGRSLPNEMEYLGCEFVSPAEEFRAIFERKSMGRKIDPSARNMLYEITRSDLFLIKIKTALRGEDLPDFYLYLPYISRGGMIHMGGTAYNIMPVVSDYIISLIGPHVFVKLLKDKLRFERDTYAVCINGQVRNLVLMYSHIHHNSKNKNPGAEKTTKAKATIIHYMLGKMGFTGMWEKYFGFKPVVGYADITEDKYPRDKWTIYESSGLKPSTFLGNNWQPPRVKIAVPNEHVDSVVNQAMAGFFCTIDNFSEYIDVSMLENTKLWRIWLGHIYYTGKFSVERLSRDIDEHFRFIDGFIDEFVEKKLAEAGYVVKDFYDLLYVILKNNNVWTAKAREINESIYHRYVDVLYYILYEVTTPIFKTALEINELYKDDKLTREAVIKTVTRFLSPRKIFDLTSTSNPNMSILHVEYSGDNLYAKMTAAMNVQEMGEGVKRAKRRDLPERLKNVHGTEYVVGSMFYLPKKTPSPLFRMNPFTAVDATTGKVQPSEETKAQSLRLAELIASKSTVSVDDTEMIEVEDDIDD